MTALFRNFCTLIVLGFLFCPTVFADEQNGEILSSSFLGLRLEMDSDWYNATETGVDDRLLLASREGDKAYLLISRLPGLGRTLQSFDIATRHFIYTSMGGFLDHEAHTTVDGRPAYLWVYQGQSRVEDNGWRQFYRVIAEIDGDFVVFQGVVNPSDFPRYRGSLESMINSVTWTSISSETE